MNCNCGSPVLYKNCCEIFHNNHLEVQTAEALMRSRYCAYTLHNVDYIYETTLPASRKGLHKADILAWAKANKWLGLEIIKASVFTVEFKAHYIDEQNAVQVHHEKSTFKKYMGKWYFEKGIYPG